jgi:hypothetical protein
MPEAHPLFAPYEQYLEKYGRRPESFASWTQSLAIEPGPGIRGFLTLDQALFRSWLVETIELLEGESLFQQYQTREKVLALFFTWMEQWHAHKDALRVMAGYAPALPFSNDYFSGTHDLFTQWLGSLLREGLERGEIAPRWKLNDWYAPVFWQQARFLIMSFLNDSSPQYTQTDAAVEKTIRFIMDLIQPNSLDSGVDLVRFLFRKS